MLAERQRQRNAAEHRSHAASGTWQKEEEEEEEEEGGGGGGAHRTSSAAGSAAASEGRGRFAPGLVAKAMQRVPPSARAPCWARPVLALASIGGIGARPEALGPARPEGPTPSTEHSRPRPRRPRRRGTPAGAGLPSGPQGT